MACDSPYTVDRGPAFAATQRNVAVPCGRCPVCKRNRINQWVFRLMQEDKHSSSSYFLTLTYNTDNIPISSNGFKTLLKKDYQDFMKRLRHYAPDVSLRYYAVGEYGSKTMRPHYHAILFNLPDTDLIEKAWQKGDVHFGTVSGASIAYTAKYIDKDSKIPMHRNDDRVKEFSLMSKGLGKQYLSDAIKKYHKADLNRHYVRSDQGHKIPMPRYYKNQIYSEDELTAIRFLSKLAVNEQEAQEIANYERQYSEHPAPPSFEFHKDKKRLARYEKKRSKQDRRDEL